MLLSLQWLREFVPFEGSAEELGRRLTMLGLELEGIHRPFAHLEPFVVGHVLTCERHPEADKLSVCTVDVGQGEPLSIVCGAPNVAAGQKVPVACIGVTMPDGLKIKKAKLRGVASHGMICSERELGLSEDHSGIMVLDDSAVPGTSLLKVLPLDEEVLEIGITPNRGDCLSVLGLAREVALSCKLPLTLPSIRLVEEGPSANDIVRLEIENPALCPQYLGRVISGGKTGKSPAWMRYRLQACGIRSISNFVDVTNYVLLELGHPLHAFDLDTLKGGVIVVRTPRDGETLVTLDGQERALAAGDLLICDAEKPVGLAGVMGGLNSEITEKTVNVFLECAVFEPIAIRRTARRLGMQSEASYRFERGVDRGLSEFVAGRAAALMAEVAGAVVRPGVCKAEPRALEIKPVRFRASRAELLLGTNPGENFCRETLELLGCSVSDGKDEWSVIPPTHRPDLTREADLIEEIGRVYGVDRIAPTLPKVSRSLEAGCPDTEYHFLLKIKGWAAGLGLNEAINYSFVGEKELDALMLPETGRIHIMNPLSAEQNVLRPHLAPGLLNALRHNIAQGNSGVRLFETAHIFSEDPSSETTAKEQGRLAILLYGSRYDSLWPHREADADYQDLKGIVEHLLERLGLGEAEYLLVEGESAYPYLLPCVAVCVHDSVVGYIGRIRPEMAEFFHARKDIWFADMDTDMLRTLSKAAQSRFKSLPQYPPVRRDITVVAPATMPVRAVVDHVRGLKLPLLEDVTLLDVYEPENQPDKRNLTYRMTFRHSQRTLQDSEVDKIRESVAKSLVQKLGVTL